MQLSTEKGIRTRLQGYEIFSEYDSDGTDILSILAVKREKRLTGM